MRVCLCLCMCVSLCACYTELSFLGLQSLCLLPFAALCRHRHRCHCRQWCWCAAAVCYYCFCLYVQSLPPSLSPFRIGPNLIEDIFCVPWLRYLVLDYFIIVHFDMVYRTHAHAHAHVETHYTLHELCLIASWANSADLSNVTVYIMLRVFCIWLWPRWKGLRYT